MCGDRQPLGNNSVFIQIEVSYGEKNSNLGLGVGGGENGKFKRSCFHLDLRGMCCGVFHTHLPMNNRSLWLLQKHLGQWKYQATLVQLQTKVSISTLQHSSHSSTY